MNQGPLDALYAAAGSSDPDERRAFLTYHRELIRRCHAAEAELGKAMEENTRLVQTLKFLQPLTFADRYTYNRWLDSLLRRVVAWDLAENVDAIRASVHDSLKLVTQMLGGTAEFAAVLDDVKYELRHGDLRWLNEEVA